MTRRDVTLTYGGWRSSDNHGDEPLIVTCSSRRRGCRVGWYDITQAWEKKDAYQTNDEHEGAPRLRTHAWRSRSRHRAVTHHAHAALAALSHRGRRWAHCACTFSAYQVRRKNIVKVRFIWLADGVFCGLGGLLSSSTWCHISGNSNGCAGLLWRVTNGMAEKQWRGEGSGGGDGGAEQRN